MIKKSKKINPSKNINEEELKEIKNIKIDNDIQMYGKVAKFPKNIKPSNAYKFLENIKVDPEKLWYILLQQKENHLQMIKYNNTKGVNLNEFLSGLKEYYLNSKLDESVKKEIEKIEIIGEDYHVTVKNVPNVIINEKMMITQVIEDLIKILRNDGIE